MARREYSAEVKAAVMAALLAGQSLSWVSEEYQIPRSTVANWSAEARRSGAVPDQKRAELGELIVECVRENIQTMVSQAQFFRRADWLEKQSASEVAVLYGVVADKTFRILSALDANERDVGAAGLDAATGAADAGL